MSIRYQFRRTIQALILVCVACHVAAESAVDSGIALQHTSAGGLTVPVALGGVQAEFLLDTGATMPTISRDLFNQVRKQVDVTKVRQVGARLASGKIRLMDVYLIESLQIGSVGAACDLGPVEVAVMRGKGRNLLGLSALAPAAPITIELAPARLSLAGCVGGAVAAL